MKKNTKKTNLKIYYYQSVKVNLAYVTAALDGQQGVQQA